MKTDINARVDELEDIIVDLCGGVPPTANMIVVDTGLTYAASKALAQKVLYIFATKGYT